MKRTKKTSAKTLKMAEAVGDAYFEKANKIDVLCFALHTLSKGTRYKDDAEDIIKAINPKYFQDLPR